MNNETKTEIVNALIELATNIHSDITFRTMYGGTVIELKKNDPKSRVGGVFTYTDYVSLELTNGIALDDPDGVLEGSGKLRRHVKLRKFNDIKQKSCETFLHQAILSD